MRSVPRSQVHFAHVSQNCIESALPATISGQRILLESLAKKRLSQTTSRCDRLNHCGRSAHGAANTMQPVGRLVAELFISRIATPMRRVVPKRRCI